MEGRISALPASAICCAALVQVTILALPQVSQDRPTGVILHSFQNRKKVNHA